MTRFDWIALGSLAACYGAVWLFERWQAKSLRETPKPTTITLDMDQLMPGEVWKCTTERYDLAILSYEDLESMCARGGYALRNRTARKAAWEPK